MKQEYLVALFKSVSHLMKAEKILKEEGVKAKIIPVPKSISTECGVCIRFEPQIRADIEKALADKVEINEIRELQ